MLFQETLIQYEDSIKEAVKELFETAYSNQINDTDLLLVLENGLKQKYSQESLERLKITPYSIGPDHIGLRYSSFYDFINQCRKTIFKRSEHLPATNKLPTDQKHLYNYLIEQELLIYLKFWETDLILRRLFNLSRLAQSLEYCWEYDQNKFNQRRKIVKDEIQQSLKRITPKFYQLLDEIYSRQIRNAIAHSQYYLLYDTIILTNKEENSAYKLNSITYEDWEIIFHKNILFYNFLIYFFNEYSIKYQEIECDKQNGLLIVFPDKNYKGNNKTGWIKFNKDSSRWIWNNL